MAYKHYNRGLISRLVAVLLFAVAIGLAVGYSAGWEIISVLIISEVVSVYSLIYFLNQTHRKIDYFIQAVKNDDTSVLFPQKTGSKMLDELHTSLNELNKVIQEKNIRNRMNERYFSDILHHIGTAVVVFNQNEFVLNVNRAALELFGLNVFTHLKQLDKVDVNIRQMLIGNNKDLKGNSIMIKKGSELLQLSIRSSVIRLRNEDVTLTTIQDIRGELERKEMDSWVKLIKVLNHEIMNSLTPVTSIAQSLNSLWNKHAKENKDNPLISRTLNGLNVIEERGEALMRFVESYRMFTKMPDIKLANISMYAFFDRLSILASPMKEEHNVSIRFIHPQSDFNVKMDEQLMVQVIINLIKNGTHALNGVSDPFVEIACKHLKNQSAEIIVTDNGCGIPDDLKDEIFIPFFTTKSEGTGIGLSYSRQIMRAHGGTISCNSKPGKTDFFVRW